MGAERDEQITVDIYLAGKETGDYSEFINDKMVNIHFSKKF